MASRKTIQGSMKRIPECFSIFGQTVFIIDFKTWIHFQQQSVKAEQGRCFNLPCSPPKTQLPETSFLPAFHQILINLLLPLKPKAFRDLLPLFRCIIQGVFSTFLSGQRVGISTPSTSSYWPAPGMSSSGYPCSMFWLTPARYISASCFEGNISYSSGRVK